jgi:hypothetical protein
MLSSGRQAQQEWLVANRAVLCVWGKVCVSSAPRVPTLVSCARAWDGVGREKCRNYRFVGSGAVRDLLRTALRIRCRKAWGFKSPLSQLLDFVHFFQKEARHSVGSEGV